MSSELFIPRSACFLHTVMPMKYLILFYDIFTSNLSKMKYTCMYRWQGRRQVQVLQRMLHVNCQVWQLPCAFEFLGVLKYKSQRVKENYLYSAGG